MPSINLIHVTLELWGTVFSFICALILFSGRRAELPQGKTLMGMLILDGLLLGNDALAWIFRGGSGGMAWHMVRISNFLVFLCTVLMDIAFFGYVCQILKEKGACPGKPVIWAAAGIGIAALVMVLVNPVTHFYYRIDEANLYHRGTGYLVSTLLPFGLVLLTAGVIVYRRKRLSKSEFLALMSYILLPMIAAVAQLLLYGISFVVVAVTVSLLLTFLVHEVEQTKRIAEREKRLMEQEMRLVQQQSDWMKRELDLSEKRTQVMLSQIQPHFLYNSLTAISVLCKKDPPRASQAIDYFADYLRKSLDSLKSTDLIPFDKELEHIRSYLWLEQLRFGSDVNVVYEIEATDFSLPPMSVQTLVENAVKHGILNNEDGGTVRIATRRNDTGVQIVIEDDGIGFDPAVQKEDGRPHIGIPNTRQRLQVLCGGTLTIDSSLGGGSTITITIPERRTI